MNQEQFPRVVERLDELWPGVTGGWSEQALRNLAAASRPYTIDSCLLAVTRLSTTDLRGKFRPDPADVIRYIHELGEPDPTQNRRLPARTERPAVPWSEASKVLHGEYRPLASLAGGSVEEESE